MRLVTDKTPSGAGSVLDPDGDILTALMAGDTQAFGVLMDRHMTKIHALASYMLKDPVLAEDVTQTVFLKTWQVLPDWTPGQAKLITWIRRVATHQCLDVLKKKRPSYTDQLPDMADDRGQGFEAANARDQQRLVAAALAQIPDRQRLALTLSYYQNVSQAEGADIMGITITAYDSLLVRARKAMRGALMEVNDMTGGVL